MAEGQTPSPGRSVLYYLGKLTAEVAASRDDIKDLKTDVSHTLHRHGVEIERLKRNQYLWMGGGSLLVILVGWVIDAHPFK